MSYVADQSVSVPMTSSDIERRDMRGQICLEDLCKYACTVLAKMIKCSMLTRGEMRISKGQPYPSQGGGARVPKIFGTSYMHAHGIRNSNQLLHGDQTR